MHRDRLRLGAVGRVGPRDDCSCRHMTLADVAVWDLKARRRHPHRELGR